VSAKPVTVYIVDDDEPVRDSLSALLESYGLTVAAFESCPAFIDAYRGPERSCLLLDLHLPVMGGFDLLARFRDRLAGLPVIVITGRGDRAVRSRVLEAGARDLIEKPFEDEALLTAIRSALTAAPAAADRPAG